MYLFNYLHSKKLGGEPPMGSFDYKKSLSIPV